MGPAQRLPPLEAWAGGARRGALPQLPLTLLNSVVAVSVLSEDLFPGRGIPPSRMATSVGLMNLAALPLGGVPMCHGSGGLAAQYHFGARSGAAVVALGGMKTVAGLLLGAGVLGQLHAYPFAVLGPMLVFAGWELGRVARDQLWSPGLVPTVGGAAALVAWNTLAGCLVALALWCVVRAWETRVPVEESA